MILRAIGEMFGTIHSWILRRCIECLLLAVLFTFGWMVMTVNDPEIQVKDDKGSILHQLTEDK